MKAFLQELSKLGWIEGKNFTIEYRFGEQKSERLPELAADLVRLKVDLIVVNGTPQTLAAKKATTTIPIVMASSGDPVESTQRMMPMTPPPSSARKIRSLGEVSCAANMRRARSGASGRSRA